MSMTDLRWKEKHLDQMRKDYEAMRQARQDARDVVRWRSAALRAIVNPERSWMRDDDRRPMPDEICDELSRCVADIEANLEASWSEV